VVGALEVFPGAAAEIGELHRHDVVTRVERGEPEPDLGAVPVLARLKVPLPCWPQRKPIEPFGTTTRPLASSKATVVFQSGLLVSPRPSPKSDTRRRRPGT
jgi:hypothetical protein